MLDLPKIFVISAIILLIWFQPVRCSGTAEKQPSKKPQTTTISKLNQLLKDLTNCMDHLDKTVPIIKQIYSAKDDATTSKSQLIEQLKGDISKKCTQARFQLLGSKPGLNSDRDCEISLQKFYQSVLSKLETAENIEMNRWQELMLISDKEVMQLKCQSMVTNMKIQLVDLEAKLPGKSVF